MVINIKMTQTENDKVQSQVQKKPKSAYLHFCGEKRSEVKADNLELSPKQILSRLGELWQELKTAGGDNYNKYIKLAEEEKVKYQSLKESEPKVLGKGKSKDKSKGKESEVVEVVEVEEEGKKSRKKVIDGTEVVKKKPRKKVTDGAEVVEKKPRKLNGYIKYLQAQRQGFIVENPTCNSKQIMKQLAERWTALSDQDKQTWKDS